MKKLDVDNLTPDEVQKELLKLTILNNKRLKSIDYSIAFICVVIIIGILLSIFGAIIR